MWRAWGSRDKEGLGLNGCNRGTKAHNWQAVQAVLLRDVRTALDGALLQGRMVALEPCGRFFKFIREMKQHKLQMVNLHKRYSVNPRVSTADRSQQVRRRDGVLVLQNSWISRAILLLYLLSTNWFYLYWIFIPPSIMNSARAVIRRRNIPSICFLVQGFCNKKERKNKCAFSSGKERIQYDLELFLSTKAWKPELLVALYNLQQSTLHFLFTSLLDYIWSKQLLLPGCQRQFMKRFVYHNVEL